MVRLKREDRERHILDGAVKFFSERGFSGQTRELAKSLGITQPLLYRYFPSKKELIDRVYKELFLNRWNPAWDVLITNRQIPLRDRIRQFYLEFSETIFSEEWVRMFIYSGLNQVEYNRQTLENLQNGILRRICVELRLHCGYDEVRADRITAVELEYAWELHGVAFYYHVRKYVYRVPVGQPIDDLVSNMADAFLAGAPNVLQRSIGPVLSTKNGARASSKQ